VIVPDINLLLHAYNISSLVHDEAKAWWEGRLDGSESVGLAWVTVLGFIRIGTTLRTAARPLHVREACDHVRTWLTRSHVGILHPGDRHADILFGLLEQLGVGGNLTTDAHLAALAIEYQAELYSTDADFARFPGLRWRNPLK
jgi:toxin-antitoxin system PIN domain toxin